MFESFLPPEVAQLTEETSIALASQIRQSSIETSISSEAIETAYVHQGEGGIPILLLHGFDSSVFEFRRLLPKLAAHHDTWIVDLLGFGFTDRPINIPFNPEAIKTHLYDFWKEKIAQPVILIGASMGGAAAIDFVLSHPDAVSKLVLLDSAGFAAGPAIGKFLIPPLGYLATEFLRRPNVRRSVSLKAYCDPSFVTEDAELCAALHLKLSRWNEALITFTKSGGYNFLSNKIQQITCSTLILWGDSDQILGTKDAQRFRNAIANSKLIWIEQCGHVPHLEKPELTAKHILEFSSL
ncbi:MAG: alpha/beta fold hydrolase [Phormidium tanganyikae FI6-MK23]|jgi:pimeloyl-ACP methyl ester carboxylesterase|nr:alpha/beta fold hydrolase [Phormidium tanganyikae FI6-MK23]